MTFDPLAFVLVVTSLLPHARLDEKASLADLDWRFNPKLPRATCFELHTLKFITEGATP
jgi:hypothetical protein